MSRSRRNYRSGERLDISSIRDTLLYIQSDVAHAPGMERLAGSVADALREIAVIERDMPEAYRGERAQFFPTEVH